MTTSNGMINYLSALSRWEWSHLDGLAFVLSLEHDPLNRLDPLITIRLSIRRKRVILLRSPNLEVGLVDSLTTGNVLQGDVALGEIWVGSAFIPAEHIVSQDHPKFRVALCARCLLVKRTGLDDEVLRKLVRAGNLRLTSLFGMFATKQM